MRSPSTTGETLCPSPHVLYGEGPDNHHSNDPNAQLLVLDLDVATQGNEIATLRGQPDPLTETDLDHLFTLLRPTPEDLEELGNEG